MTITIRLFGQPQIYHNQTPVQLSMKKALALVAYLVTTAEEHYRERVAGLLWPDSSESVARTSLRQVIQAIKQTPLASVLRITRHTISLTDDVQSDVQRFNALMAYKDYTQMNLSMEAAARLQTAQSLYEGDFLDGFYVPGSLEWEDWQQFRRIEFQHQITGTVAALTRHYLVNNLPTSGLKMVQWWLELDPLNEEAHHFAMHLYMLAGQVARAIEQYHLFVRLLEREQQRPPDDEMQQTYTQIRQGVYRIPNNDAFNPFGKTVRSLFPKPSAFDPSFTDECTAILKTLERQQPTFLIVVYEEQNDDASNLISYIAHSEQTRLFFPDGVLWAKLASNADFEAVLRLWMDAMRLSILKSTSKLEHLAWQFHNGQRDKRLVFLLEGVANADHAQLITPAYKGCTLIMTTSKRDVTKTLSPQADLLLDLSTKINA